MCRTVRPRHRYASLVEKASRSVGFEVAPLSLSKPEILSLQQRVEFTNAVLELASMSIVVLLRVELVNKRLEDHEQSRRIGIMWILDLELLRYFAARFSPKNLLPRNPAIFVHEIEPALYNL